MSPCMSRSALISVLLARAMANEDGGSLSFQPPLPLPLPLSLLLQQQQQPPLQPPRCSDGTPVHRVHHGEPPNIVVVMVDDLGFEDLGYRGSLARTPHIDDLAARAVHVNRCAPSHANARLA